MFLGGEGVCAPPSMSLRLLMMGCFLLRKNFFVFLWRKYFWDGEGECVPPSMSLRLLMWGVFCCAKVFLVFFVNESVFGW